VGQIYCVRLNFIDGYSREQHLRRGDLTKKSIIQVLPLQLLFIYGILDFIYDLVLQVDNKTFYGSFAR
jgi:hypothetical protein